MILSPEAYWRTATADRAAYLVDGAAYFRAFREAALQAQRSILLLGWDFNSQTPLLPDGERPADGLPTRLVPFLDALVRQRKSLHVDLLNWDFAVVYAAEREPLPVVRFNWTTDRRFHFAFDSELPFGASHHQKVVVIDDKIAFLGGLDLTACRWDTPDHDPEDGRRVTADGDPYGPFHDIQFAVTGEAARALGELARARWVRATGKKIAPPPERPGVIWPASAPVHFTRQRVAFARTFAAYKDWPAVREIYHLHEQAIRAARKFLYFENEYLTSHDVSAWLAARLAEPRGPEIVIVVPLEQSGWLEQSTMGVLRTRVLRQLRAADRYGRLRVLAPVSHGAVVNLHAKAFVVDDLLMKVGSSNLSNRSMGFDSEIDLIIDAEEDSDAVRRIGRFRETLLAEHLGVTSEAFSEAMAARNGSLLGAIDALRSSGPRTLVDLEPDTPPILESMLPDDTLLDPERPMSYAAFVLGIASESRLPDVRITWRRAVKLLLLIVVLTAAVNALGREQISLSALRSWFAASVPGAPWVLLGAGLAAALLFVPVLPLLAIIAVLVEPWQALAIGVVVSLAGAASGYATGRSVRRERVRRLAGHWAERVFPWLERDRMLDFVWFRLFSGVPYGLANLLAGAARVPIVRYMAASFVALGLTALTVVVFTQVIGLAVSDPEPVRLVALGSLIALYAWLNRAAQKIRGEGEDKSRNPS